jgi:hypothetical protein
MFKIYTDNGNIDVNNLDDICYIITKNGTYLRKKVGLTDAIIKVNNISHLSDSVQRYGRINIPKIPNEDFAKICKFFYWAYKKHGGESVVLIYYNDTTKEFEIFPTDQEVSSASAKYKKSGKSHDGFLLVGTIHSHANFGAGHSGVDDDDELNFDGLHITVGNVNDTYPSISCSVVVNGERFMYDPEEYVEGVKKKIVQHSKADPYYSENDEIISRCYLPQGYMWATPNKDVKKSISHTYDDKRYFIENFTSIKFDNDWKDKVQKRIKSQYKNLNSIHKQLDFRNLNEYLDYFNNDVKNKNNFNNDKNKMKTNDIKNSIPCENCIYRDYKSQYFIQEMMDLMGDVFDEDDINYYFGIGTDSDDETNNDEEDNE